MNQESSVTERRKAVEFRVGEIWAASSKFRRIVSIVVRDDGKRFILYSCGTDRNRLCSHASMREWIGKRSAARLVETQEEFVLS